jgi:predicted transcriptional regulator
MITDEMLGLDDVSVEALDTQCVGDVMETDVVTVANPYDVENVLHLLVDNPFLPVVQDDGSFTGIVTRREVMKGINYIGHNLDHYYQMTPKEAEAEHSKP